MNRTMNSLFKIVLAKACSNASINGRRYNPNAIRSFAEINRIEDNREHNTYQVEFVDDMMPYTVEVTKANVNSVVDEIVSLMEEQ